MNMKIKNLLILGLLAISSTALMAQSVGLRVGVNSTNIGVAFDEDPATEDEFDFDAAIRFQVGLVAEIPLAGPVGIETGVIYNGYGAKGGNLIEGDLRLDYIQIPLTLKLRADIGELSLFVHGGPYAALAFGGKDETTFFGISTEDEVNFGDGIDEYNRLDFGLLVGGGVGFGPIDLGVNYGYGLANIRNLDDIRLANRLLSLTLTYRFDSAE